MHELAAVWADRNGRVWIGVSALLYLLALIPFNYLGAQVLGIPIRPAALLPVTLGILFGPAAAWGLGLSNIASDFFGGSWSMMSIAGAFVNFLYPYLSYRLFHGLMKSHAIGRDFPTLFRFLGVSLVVTSACMFLLAALGTLFFARPFVGKLATYLGNNIFWAIVAGPVFFWLVADHAIRNKLVYGREWQAREKAGNG